MKRSEMVNLIAEALLIPYGGDQEEREEVRDSTRMIRIKNAHIALKTAEEQGMLPPCLYLPSAEEHLNEEETEDYLTDSIDGYFMWKDEE